MAKKRGISFSGIYLTLILIIMYVPIVLVVIFSFNESKISSLWGGFSLNWYGELFRDRSMFEALRNSVVLGLLSSFSAAVIGTLAATGLTRYKLKSGKVMEYFATLPIMIPEIIMGMVFLTFFSLLGLPFGMVTLVIAHTSFCIPYVFLMVKARLAGLDKSYVEAARDLGASELRAFYDITMPLAMPAIVSGMLLSFAMSFDDVIISVFVTGVNTNTLPMKIYSQIKTGVTPKTNALCALIFVVTIFLCALSMRISKKK
ncbi:MAG: ABC transporter permease [Clostridiales bacterium]|jgi:spermidine/putrescine transport system permease protein|nr:ABC transporter permease [Clostridiales bacterium]